MNVEMQQVPIRPTRFRSDDYPPSEAEPAYQHLFASSARVSPIATPFFVDVESYRSDDVSFHFMQAVPFNFERSAEKIAFDGVDLFVVQHVEIVGAEGDFDGRPVSAPEGSLYGIDFSRPCRIVDGARTGQRRNFVSMKRSFAERWLGPLHDLHGSVVAPAQAAPYVAQLKLLRSMLPGRVALDSRLVDETAALLAAAFETADRQGRPASCPLLDRACHHVQRNIARRDLRADTVADAIGVSRSKLFSLFKPFGGVERYIWARRLENVHGALGLDARPRSITELGHMFGFRDVAQLSRMFKRRYGIAPSELKKKAK